MISTRPLYSLLDQARMIAVDTVVLVISATGQYRVNKKTFTKLSEAGWIAPQQQSGDFTEYGLTQAGKEVAIRLKNYNEQFMQLSLWEAERARHEQQQLF
jgi:predicted transcriptional regulator